MSMKKDIPRLASEAETDTVAVWAEPIIEQITAMPGQLGLHVLCYTAAALVLVAETTIPKLEAWDHVAATIRKTIEDNQRVRSS